MGSPGPFSVMADAYSELGRHPADPADPDAQQTLTDFIDYTEFFPSDLLRSLTLIQTLDETFRSDAQQVHQLTKTYGDLPSLPAEQRPQPKKLRRDISTTLDHAIRSREASLAEATRLCNVADALYEKMVGIKAKLIAMPKPPSRDPTPVPQASKSPTTVRNRKHDRNGASKNPAAQKDSVNAAAILPKPQKNRQRRLVVPGEPLPPFDPASPGADISSESESEPESPPVRPIRVEPFGMGPRGPKKFKEPKAARAPRPYSTAGPLPKVRPRGVFGTNVHSQVAGISVSNAMASLTPPPDDPPPGSEWAPWLELTDWELNILRRRMKKNAHWTPSDTMKRRTLSEKGRGVANYLKAKEDAERNGIYFLNEKPHRTGRTAEPVTPGTDVILHDHQENTVNRGMKLNEQKKLKQARDLIAASEMQQQQLQGQRQSSTTPSQAGGTTPGPSAGASGSLNSSALEKIIADAGRSVQELIGPLQQGAQLLGLNSPSSVASVEGSLKAGRKRKAALQEGNRAASESGGIEQPHTSTSPSASKKLKTSSSGGHGQDVKEVTVTSQVPLAPEGPSSPPPPKRGRPRKTSASKGSTPAPASTSEATTAAGSPRSTTMQPPVTGGASNGLSASTVLAIGRRPSSSRGAPSLTLTMNIQKSASAEPPSRKISLRRSSNVSLPLSQADAPRNPAPRKGRKPAPGLPRNDGDDTATVTSTKRKTKPGRPVEKNLPVDEIDPDEPRYCICNDVSYGDMVECENHNCDGGEWFHFGCVGLSERPPRRQKWYCPICRAKMGVDAAGAPVAAAKNSGGHGRNRA